MTTNRKWNRIQYLAYFTFGTILCFISYFTNEYPLTFAGLALFALGLFRWLWLEKRLSS